MTINPIFELSTRYLYIKLFSFELYIGIDKKEARRGFGYARDGGIRAFSLGSYVITVC